MNLTVITSAEADVFLASYADWLALSEAQKTYAIERASTYAQTNWECADVVWEDDTDTDEVEAVDIPELIKKAVAFYAYADISGTLYGDPATIEESKGNLRSQKDTVGELSTETEWFRGGQQFPVGSMAHLGYPDALMATECTSCSYGSVEVVRV